MTIGPEPMRRMLLMSLRLGTAEKSRHPRPRPLSAEFGSGATGFFGDG